MNLSLFKELNCIIKNLYMTSWREDLIVQAIYKYYCNRNDTTYNSIIKELLEIKLENRMDKITSSGYDIFAVYLDFQNPKEFDNFLMDLKKSLRADNII